MNECPGCHQQAKLLWTKEGPRCIRCAEGSQLAPSGRQMSLFSKSFFASTVVQVLLLPVASPLLLLLSFLSALWKRIDGAWRMLPAIVALLLFWVLLLPPLLQDPSGGDFLVVFLFLLLLFFIQLPALFVSRNMILRGHGLLAGTTLSAFSVALLVSLIAPCIILLL